jgi:hypothetical protein
MLAEALHATADTGNELPVAGWNETEFTSSRRVRSLRTREGALFLFPAGSGFDLWSRRWPRYPQIPDHSEWNYAVLFVSAIFEVVFMAHFVS